MLKSEGAKHLVRASIESLPFKDNSLDGIIIVDVIHHFVTRGYDSILKEINRVLKPGGKIYVQEINKFGIFRLPIAFLPQVLLIQLRNLKGLFKKGYHKPEVYEAPMSKRKFMKKLKSAMIFESEIIACPQYPEINKRLLRIWKVLRKCSCIAKNHSFHWLVIIRKVGNEE